MKFPSVFSGCSCQWLVLTGLMLASLASVAATDGTAKLEFTTVTPQGKHSPKHVLAVWVADARTNFVKTVCRFAGKRQKYLFTWQAARGTDATVDGVTGATLPAHETRTATWDGCDAQKKSLPDGQYYFCVEFTDAHSQGPTAMFPLTKGPAAQVKRFPDQPNFKNITLSFTPKRR